MGVSENVALSESPILSDLLLRNGIERYRAAVNELQELPHTISGDRSVGIPEALRQARKLVDHPAVGGSMA